MSQWLIVNLPGMVFNSMLESAVATLIAYVLCAVFLFYSGRHGLKVWNFLFLYLAVLIFQGVINLVLQMIIPPSMPELTLRIVIIPIVVSLVVLILVKRKEKKT